MNVYEIVLEDYLDLRWGSLFDGLEMQHQQRDGRYVTILQGPLPDPTALYGVIGRLRDLGGKLISIQIKESRGT